MENLNPLPNNNSGHALDSYATSGLSPPQLAAIQEILVRHQRAMLQDLLQVFVGTPSITIPTAVSPVCRSVNGNMFIVLDGRTLPITNLQAVAIEFVDANPGCRAQELVAHMQAHGGLHFETRLMCDLFRSFKRKTGFNWTRIFRKDGKDKSARYFLAIHSNPQTSTDDQV